jgi:hypothetical protein
VSPNVVHECSSCSAIVRAGRESISFALSGYSCGRNRTAMKQSIALTSAVDRSSFQMGDLDSTHTRQHAARTMMPSLAVFNSYTHANSWAFLSGTVPCNSTYLPTYLPGAIEKRISHNRYARVPFYSINPACLDLANMVYFNQYFATFFSEVPWTSSL